MLDAQSKKKILGFTVCRKKSSNSNFHRPFVKTCACRNSKIKKRCKKKEDSMHSKEGFIIAYIKQNLT